MPKYRVLTIDELKEFKKEFVDYLVLNGITADDWERMLKENAPRADEITDLFSDVIFEKIMRSTNYLVKFDTKKIYSFKCDESDIQLACIETSSDGIDFTKEGSFEILKSDPPSDLSGFNASKNYNTSREQEIFKMIENGCVIDDGAWYNSLNQLING